MSVCLHITHSNGRFNIIFYANYRTKAAIKVVTFKLSWLQEHQNNLPIMADKKNPIIIFVKVINVY